MRIDATPVDALFDERIKIRAMDCRSGASVTVTATALDDFATKWESSATFTADASGTVDLARDAPISGSYPGRDAVGLFWSMRIDSSAQPTPFIKTRPTPVTVSISAQCEGETSNIGLTRRYLAAGVKRVEVRDAGMFGTMFEHDESRPGVLMVTGSGGGLAEDMPALVASHGYAVLSLAYFGVEHLPPDLMNIPLEYFGRAIEWMRNRPSVIESRIAVSGASRGGELALLLGATFPQIKGVIAYVPSGVVWEGLGRSFSIDPTPAWTLGGKAIPFVKASRNPAPWASSPAVLTPDFLDTLGKLNRDEWPEIEVERINGPILMFSGSDDQMWPSLKLTDIAAERLLRKNFKHHFDHVTYAGAGHFIRFPYLPAITEIFHPVVRVTMALGGDPVANATADQDSWRRMLGFLQDL